MISPSAVSKFLKKHGTLKRNANLAGVSQRTIQSWKAYGITEKEMQRARYLVRLEKEA